MYKRLFFAVILLSYLNICMAEDNIEKLSADKRADNTINQIIKNRADIYNKLNLASEQKAKIDVIDYRFYEKIRPKFVNNYVAVDEMLKMPENQNCKKKDLKNKVKEIKISDRRYFNEIKKDYRKEFDEILTPQQKKLYSKLKKNKIKEMKLEIKNSIQEQ